MAETAKQQQHPELADERVLAILSPANLINLEFFRQHLGRVFPRLDIICPREREHLQQVVENAAPTHRLVLAVGGDGTLHQVLQRLDTGAQALGVLPAGTGNDVARSIDFPRRLAARIGRLADLQLQPTDFGTVNGRRFINSAGFGIDSEVLRVMRQGRGMVAQNYNLAFITTLLRLGAVQADVTCDGEQLDGRFFWMLGMNTPYIGGGTRIAPRALLDDGFIDMVLVRETGRFNLLRFLPAAVRGSHLNLDPVVYRQARRMTIRTEQPVDYVAIDGELEFCGKRTVTIEARPRELMFLR